MCHHWLISLPLIIWSAPLDTQWQDTQKMNIKSLKREESKSEWGKSAIWHNILVRGLQNRCKKDKRNGVKSENMWEMLGKHNPTVAILKIERKSVWDYMLTSGSYSGVMTLHLFSLFIKAFLIEQVYKMDFQTMTNDGLVLGLESIHFLFA